MAIDKRILAAGGIIAVAGTLTLSKMEDNAEQVLTKEQVIGLAIPGHEITALRTANSETYKVNEYKLKTKIYAETKYYLDDETGKYEKPDLSVNEISALAKINPLREHDKYVDAGKFSAAWLNSDESDYKFTDSKDGFVKFTTLHDTKGIAVFKQVTEKGVKQSYVMLEPRQDNALRWLLDASSDIQLKNDGSVLITGSDIVIPAPIAWDNNNKPVNVTVKTSGDTLIYEPDIKGAEFPITIDPSAIVNDADAMSGYTYGVGANSASTGYATAHDSAQASSVSGAAILIGQFDDGANQRLYRSRMVFDTSAIPDSAIIDSSLVKLVAQYVLYCNLESGMHIIETTDSLSSAHLNVAMHNEFKGWAAGTSAYTVPDLTDTLAIPSVSIGDTLTLRFNSLGKYKINKTGNTQFFMLSSRDVWRIQPTNTYGDEIQFEDDSPYMLVYYTLPPGLVVNVAADTLLSGTVVHSGSSYAAARDTVSGSSTINFQTDGLNWIGQNKGTSTYSVGRSSLWFDLSGLDATNTVYKAEIWFYGYADSSLTNFNIYPVTGTFTGSLGVTWFNDFKGWAASGAYSIAGGDYFTYVNDPLVYDYTAWNTNGFVKSGWNTIPLTSTGQDSLTAHLGDSLKVTLISNYDISNTAPTQAGFVNIGAGANAPYLKIYLAGKTPSGVNVTSISGDSLLVAWTDSLGDETGFRIINLDTSLAIDSTAADATSKRVGGLSVNTLYSLAIQVKGGVYDGYTSTGDYCYTKANTPGAMTITFPADSLLKFVFNVNSNPANTEFAIQDSISGKYVQKITGLDTLGATEMWGTSAFWGGANGDTVQIYPGKNYVIRAKARSGE